LSRAWLIPSASVVLVGWQRERGLISGKGKNPPPPPRRVQTVSVT
jgi:hypothetical protein